MPDDSSGSTNGSIAIIRIGSFMGSRLFFCATPILCFLFFRQVIPDMSSNAGDLTMIVFNATTAHSLLVTKFRTKDDKGVAGSANVARRALPGMGGTGKMRRDERA